MKMETSAHGYITGAFYMLKLLVACSLEGHPGHVRHYYRNEASHVVVYALRSSCFVTSRSRLRFPISTNGRRQRAKPISTSLRLWISERSLRKWDATHNRRRHEADSAKYIWDSQKIVHTCALLMSTVLSRYFTTV